ncbi:unnamed protein product [Boreogadus saida]
MGAVGMELTHITCVLEVLILSPSVLVCMLYWLVDRRARSSAKSRSFSPLDASGSVCCIVVCDPVYGDQEEDRGDDAPCLTPDCTENHSERSFPMMTLHSKCL